VQGNRETDRVEMAEVEVTDTKELPVFYPGDRVEYWMSEDCPGCDDDECVGWGDMKFVGTVIGRADCSYGVYNEDGDLFHDVHASGLRLLPPLRPYLPNRDAVIMLRKIVVGRFPLIYNHNPWLHSEAMLIINEDTEQYGKSEEGTNTTDVSIPGTTD